MKKILYKLSFIPYFIIGFCCIAFLLTNFGLSNITYDFSEELFSFLCSCSNVFFSPALYFIILICVSFQYFYRRKVKVENVDANTSLYKKLVLKVLFYLSLVPYFIWICFSALMIVGASGAYLSILAGFFSPIFILCMLYQAYFLTHAIERYEIKVNKVVMMCIVGVSLLLILFSCCFGEV